VFLQEVDESPALCRLVIASGQHRHHDNGCAQRESHGLPQSLPRITIWCPRMTAKSNHPFGPRPRLPNRPPALT